MSKYSKICLLFSTFFILSATCWSVYENHEATYRGGERKIDKRQASNSQCNDEQFACDGRCIDKTLTCDGFFDCRDDSDESSETCSSRTCDNGRFRCKSGGCINKNKLCDGFLSCVDGEDETIEQCKNNVCSTENFRCNYGGCISKRKLCDGIKDCTDGSDESEVACTKKVSPTTTTTTTSFTSTTSTTKPDILCTLPPITADKSYTINCLPNSKTCGQKPGDKISEFAFIMSQCNSGYSLSDEILGDNKFPSTCLAGKWLPEVIKCKKKCSDLSEYDLDFTCYQKFNGARVPCTSTLLEDATVIPRCKPQFHVNSNRNYRYVTCQKDGTWDKEFFTCSPDCGRTPSSSIDLIAYGKREKRGESPWNVAIYSSEISSNPEYICGGTLITSELVVSAAHCFYDESLGKKQDSRLFTVAVGKATIGYTAVDYKSVTKIYNVKQIYFPDLTPYTGERTNYASDIAILHLSDKIKLSYDVLPACLHWDDQQRFNPGENISGKLSGFGVTQNGTLALHLMTVSLPYINFNDCLKKGSPDFRDTISVDKFCAGFISGAGAQVGDSGGGLVFKDRKDGFFYLRGVVSNRDSTNSSIAAFTDIALYISWIKRIISNVDQSQIDSDTVLNVKFKGN